MKNDEVKNRVYEDFGRRVLGPPPVLGKAADEGAGLPASQMIELVSIMAAGKTPKSATKPPPTLAGDRPRYGWFPTRRRPASTASELG